MRRLLEIVLDALICAFSLLGIILVHDVASGLEETISTVAFVVSAIRLKRPCRVSRRSMRLISCLQIFFEQNPIVLLKGSSINWFRPVHRTAFVALKFLKIFIGVHILFDKTHDNTTIETFEFLSTLCVRVRNVDCIERILFVLLRGVMSKFS